MEILTNGSVVGNLSLEAGSTSLRLNNLTAASVYSLKIAAFNRSVINGALVYKNSFDA